MKILKHLAKSLVVLLVIIAMFAFTACQSKTDVESDSSAPTQSIDVQKEIAASVEDMPVVLKFFSPACGACKQMEPDVKKLEEEFKGKLRVIKVDVTLPENSELVKEHNVTAVPTLVMFGGHNKEVIVKIGLLNYETMKEDFESLLSE